MEVMQFLDKSLREISFPATLAYWGPLMDPTSRTYERAIEDELRSVAENIVAAREKLHTGEE
jgi:hypothetical protein